MYTEEMMAEKKAELRDAIGEIGGLVRSLMGCSEGLMDVRAARLVDCLLSAAVLRTQLALVLEKPPMMVLDPEAGVVSREASFEAEYRNFGGRGPLDRLRMANRDEYGQVADAGIEAILDDIAKHSPPSAAKLWNHAVDVAFSVEGPWESFDDIPYQAKLDGLRRRLAVLEANPDEGAEAFGDVGDAYKVDLPLEDTRPTDWVVGARIVSVEQNFAFEQAGQLRTVAFTAVAPSLEGPWKLANRQGSGVPSDEELLMAAKLTPAPANE